MSVKMLTANSYGGVLVNAKGDVLLREPTGHFGGYVWTFAKAKAGRTELPEQAALRAVREETGYWAFIIIPIQQVFGGTASSIAFYLMGPIGRQREFGNNTATIRWVSFEDASNLISQTRTKIGRDRDLAVLRAAREAAEIFTPGLL